VTQSDVVRQAPERRNPVSNEHRDASDDETVDEPGAEEPLNRDPPVHADVEVSGEALPADSRTVAAEDGPLLRPEGASGNQGGVPAVLAPLAGELEESAVELHPAPEHEARLFAVVCRLVAPRHGRGV